MSDGSVTIEVTLTKEQLEKGLKSINNDLNKLTGEKIGAGISKVGQIITNIGNSMVATGKKITVATAGIIAGLGTAVGRFDTLKNYPKVLSNLGFSAEDSKESIDELSEGIDGLPTALDDAASGVQRLVAKNGNIKKSTKYFLAMNDAIVAGNAPAQQQASAIEQLTQAYSKGKFDMMEWRTLMMAMPGQLKQVAKAMGYVDTDQLYNALQKGKISMDQFMDTIVELDQNGGKGFKSFKEQAKNSTDSIGTAITNLGNRIKKGFATILEGLDEMAKNTKFGSIAGIINQFSTSIKNFLDKIGNSIKNNKEIQKSFTQMSQGLTKIQSVIDKLSPEQLDAIVTAVVKLAKAGPTLIVAGKGLSFFGKATTGVGNMVTTFSKLSGVIGKIGPTAAAGSKGIGLLGKACTLLTGPVGIIIAVIASIIAILVILYNKSEAFRKTISNVFNELKNAILKAWETIKPSLQKLWDAVKKLFESIENRIVAFEPIISFIVKAFGKYWSIYINIAGKYFSIMINILAEVINAISNFANYITNIITIIINFFIVTIPAAFNSCLQSVSNFVQAAIEWFKNLPYNLGVLIGEMIVYLINFGIELYNWMTIELPKIIQGIIEWFKQLPSQIWIWLLNTINKVSEFGKKMADKGKDGSKNLFNNIVNTIKGLPNKMLEIGKNIVEGLWNGIKNAANWIKEKIGDFAKGILDGMKSALGIHSPSTLFRDQVGKNIALGVGEGFEDNISKVYRQMKSAVDFETQKLSTNLSATAMMSKVITANINVNGNVDMDGTKVGRLVAPSVSRTLRTAGA